MDWIGTLGAYCALDAGGLASRRPYLAALAAGLREAFAKVPASRTWPLALNVGPHTAGPPVADALILAGGFLLVMAFKAADLPCQAHLDLVMAQSRDLRRCNRSGHALTTIPVLVLTEAVIRPVLCDGVCVVSPDRLFGLFKMFGLDAARPAVDLAAWLAPEDREAGEGDRDGDAGNPLHADVAAWGDHLLSGRLAEAKVLADHLRGEGFDLYLTWDAEAGPEYLAERYGDAAVPAMPIVEWGEDMVWNGRQWEGAAPGRYRALLTGGRDGLIALIRPTAALDGTFKAVATAGAVQLARGPLFGVANLFGDG